MRRLRFPLLLIAISSPASAGLIGTNIQTCWNSSYTTGTVTVDTTKCAPSTGFTTTSATVADPGVEFSTLSGNRRADFSDTDVSIQYVKFSGSSTPDLYIFSGLPGTVTDMVLLTSNPLNITTAFAGNSIGLLISSPECCKTSTATVTYRLDFGAPSGVPEPATIISVAFGLAAAGFAARRRTRRAVS